jgi:hypothetical protein
LRISVPGGAVPHKHKAAPQQNSTPPPEA